MGLYFYLLLLLDLFIICLIFNNATFFSKYFGLSKKKADKTPVIGGLGIYIFLIIFNLSLLIFSKQNINFEQINILLLLTVVFIIGFIDDIYQISYTYRLLLIYLTLFVFLQFTDFYLIDYLYFESLNKTFLLDNLSIYITPFFILLLLNSLNMADGINGNSGLIIISYIILLFDKNLNLNTLILPALLAIIIFLYFNLRNKIYLGDSGVYLLSVLVSLYTINKYNFLDIKLSCEEIFVIFLIPGIDMFRLFITRIKNNKNPFKGDLNHFHHILNKRFNLTQTIIIYLLLINWPNILLKMFEINILYLIFINIFMFIFTIYTLNKLEKLSK